MKYIKLIIHLADEYQESLIAALFDMDFDGFQQFDERLVTYIMKENFGVSDREFIEQHLAAYPGEGFIESEEIVNDENWNEQWEQTIKAQAVGDFFVKPTWSNEAVPAGKMLLEIDPKMSFGTGYHETTRLMLRILPSLVKKGTEVIDAGTGTGILAIASAKLGAQKVLGFDIDPWSVTNACENILINGVEKKITIKKGSTENIPKDTKVDLVLANIQRNIILELINDFKEALGENGDLVLSGLLKKDERVILDRLCDEFEVNNITQENEWIAIHAQKI